MIILRYRLKTSDLSYNFSKINSRYYYTLYYTGLDYKSFSDLEQMSLAIKIEKAMQIR